MIDTLLTLSTIAAGTTKGGWLIPLMVLLPLICGIALAWAPRDRDDVVRSAALAVSSFVFVLSLIAALVFDWSDPGRYQLIWHRPWIEPLGVSFGFGLDAISIWLVLLTTFLMPLTVLGSFGDDTRGRTKEFYLWLLVLESALIGVFAATDLVLFYVFFELTLAPLFFLIGIFGGAQRHHAAKKFFVFTLAGSVFTFAGVLYVAWHAAHVTGAWTFYVPDLIAAATDPARGMSLTQQGWVLAAMLAGFAVKVPLFPVHTWLPLAHTEAPTSGSVILAGVLLKLGTYGLLRFAIPMVPQAAAEWSCWIGALSVVGILYAALICWVQGDIKKLVAYSSVSHMGFCVLGMFALNVEGMGGSVAYMLNHGLSTGALFLCVGMIYNRYHTRDMNELSGLGKQLPVWSTFMVFFCLASVGLPGLNGFVGEFLTILGAFTNQTLRWHAIVAALGLIFAAIYILYMVGKVVMGPVREPAAYAGQVKDLNTREIFTLAPIAVACVVLGLYPTPLLRSLEPSLKAIAEPVWVVQEPSSDAAETAARAVPLQKKQVSR